jgi:hypothetical protein
MLSRCWDACWQQSMTLMLLLLHVMRHAQGRAAVEFNKPPHLLLLLLV